MKLARYWSRATSKAPGGGIEGVARGWSNNSMEEARQMAESLAARVAARVTSGQLAKDKQYLYGDRPLPEPLLEEFPGEGSPIAVLTRNVYGALVLNTSAMMFLDIDREDPPPQQASPSNLLSGILSLFSKPVPAPAPKPTVLSAIEHVAQRNGLAVRVYRTAGGFRGIVVNRAFDPTATASESLLLAFGCDPLYIRLCKLQQSFRARLTPKPWRCHLPMPPASFPLETPAAESSFRQWLSKYDAATGRLATCRYVTTIGNAQSEPAFENLIARHDKETRAQSNLVLA